GPGLEDGGDIAKRDLDSSVAKTDDMKSLIVGWTNFLLSVAAVLTVAGLVWAGFLYITSFVDEGQAEKAKKVITYVIVGVIVILASYAIVYTIMSASF
ncbi:MAG: pilin, partial [Candidatus Peregrinibacteria bacterium]|nr:pilin [Candidatus Peregrinibacteria bacterium]